jgi:hypothetical protein
MANIAWSRIRWRREDHHLRRMLERTETIETSIPEVYIRSPASAARVNTARTISPGQMIRAFDV